MLGGRQQREFLYREKHQGRAETGREAQVTTQMRTEERSTEKDPCSLSQATTAHGPSINLKGQRKEMEDHSLWTQLYL